MSSASAFALLMQRTGLVLTNNFTIVAVVNSCLIYTIVRNPRFPILFLFFVFLLNFSMIFVEIDKSVNVGFWV